MKIRCPSCKEIISIHHFSEWLGEPVVPVECNTCGVLVLATVSQEEIVDGVAFHPPIETNLDVGTKIFVFNEQHKFHMTVGYIIDKDFYHYRVRLKLDDIVIWVPNTWVRTFPSKGSSNAKQE